ncbi:carbonic anhydrase [Candidatus Omnitrophota bacterium]
MNSLSGGLIYKIWLWKSCIPGRKVCQCRRIIAHYDCAGNPCPEEDHMQQLRKSMQNVKEWKMSVEIYGIWVDKERKAFLIN